MYRRPGRLVWYAYFGPGQRHISLGTEDQDLAAIEFSKRVDANRLQKIAPSDKPFSKIFEITYQRALTNSTPGTAYGLHNKLSDILEWCLARNAMSPRFVTTSLVEQYKADRKAGDEKRRAWTNRSINRYLDAWRRAQKVAVELGSARAESLGCFAKLKEPRPKPHDRGLSSAEIVKLLKAVKDKRYRSLFRTVIGCGLRDDEMRNLDRVDLEKRWITVTPKEGWSPKNHRYRKIPITRKTYDACKHYLDHKEKMNLDQKGIWRRLTEAAKVAEIGHVSMHDLRRAWASHLLKAGESVQNISRWLGHADLLTTQRYLRIVEERDPPRNKLPW